MKRRNCMETIRENEKKKVIERRRWRDGDTEITQRTNPETVTDRPTDTQ